VKIQLLSASNLGGTGLRNGRRGCMYVYKVMKGKERS